MARKSIGENNVKFQVVLPANLDLSINELARLSDLSKAQYIRRVLRQAVMQQAIYSQEANLSFNSRRDAEPFLAVAEAGVPYGGGEQKEAPKPSGANHIPSPEATA